MPSNKDFSELEKRIGYKFRNIELLETALTHSSYANEHGCESNERLEFLGDSILNFVVAEHLYSGGDDEGDMTDRRKGSVSCEPLAKAVKKLNAIEFLRSSINGDISKKTISDIFEAIVGAIYVDSKSIENCADFIFANIELCEKICDYKSALKEYVEREKLGSIVYRVSEERTDGCFTAEVFISEEKVGFGKGCRKKEAEKAAAKQAYDFLAICDKK